MPTLILLAGGKSTRFGRPKQLEPVGPNGEALLDLTLRDAFHAGCTAAVIVVRPEHMLAFAERFATQPQVHLVVQAEALGTAHAVMLALAEVQGTAVIANGDDHYGAGAIQQAVGHALNGSMQQHALVAFELNKTLSPGGGVNRAVCAVDAQGMLRSTVEVTGLHANANGIITSSDGRTWHPGTLVSMNLWVLRPALFPLFRELFRSHGPAKEEFGLPAVVAAAIGRQHQFHVLRTAEAWCGLTHPADAEHVRHQLAMRP
ncbi:MAG: NTP transferase domain-containing protein [Bacteroidetes bacterium]|nr:NTP transferase domain-containing protein [Bacteroidota bacterium]